jgi:hypothetical protein
MSLHFRFAFLGLFVVAAGVRQTSGAPAPPAGPFDDRLRQIAKDYLAWSRVDDEARWAPELCRLPRPAEARESASDDAKTHGKKLYSLFAKDRKAYIASGREPSPVGQVIVKQSWVPLEVPDDGQSLAEKGVYKGRGKNADHFVPFVRKDGKLFKADKQADLFIMLKVDPATENTDGGWIYGTVAADGTKVTSSGRVESCMRCHVKAANDRLFGLPGWTRPAAATNH